MSSILSAFAPRAKERPSDLAGEGEIDLLIATDCISEGQNLQDCDTLVNVDIHWNPVRIIQRFGRIDRIGSPNTQIQLVNVWPDATLDEYIDLEGRVSGRMVLLDVSATGEENVIEKRSGDPMNDLDYRRQQMVQMQDAVLDLEDLQSGVSITDLTLTDFRVDLARLAATTDLDGAPLGAFAACLATDDVPPGTVFCLRAEGEAATRTAPPGYPLAPHYLVHVGDDGAVLLPFTQAKHILDGVKRLALGRDAPDPEATARFHRATKRGEDMRAVQRQLAAAVASVVGKCEERAVASLFSPGGTHALAGEFAGADDFEVVAYLAILPRRRMTAADLIEALRLPPSTRVDQRVPKTLLVEHGAPTAADKRQIQEGIAELRWVATPQADDGRGAGVSGRRAGIRGDRRAPAHTARRRPSGAARGARPPRHPVPRRAGDRVGGGAGKPYVALPRAQASRAQRGRQGCAGW